MTPRAWVVRMGCLSWAVLAVVVPAPAQEAPAAQAVEARQPKEGERDKWVPLFQRHASEYVIRVAGEASARRLAEPVLRWWQPARGGDDGALYVWVREGRPVAAVTFFTFKWPDGKRAIVHERHSFAPGALEADWRGQTVWRAARPGVTFQPVPDAPAPAQNPASRLRQLQTLAREFDAHTVDDKDKDWPLRLLPRPLYRFEGETQDSRDGALFALAQGTDPEAFLILDGRVQGGAAHWEYAIARFTDRKLIVRHKGRDVYQGENTVGGAGEVYHSTTVILKASDSPADFD